jgi:hypothetical protein
VGELIVESEETQGPPDNCEVTVYLTIEGVLGAADFHILLY